MTELLVSESPFLAPLIEALSAELPMAGAGLTMVSVDEAAWRLRENECDAAFVSPITYALSEGEVSLVGGAVCAAVGATHDALLVFRGGLERISTLAVPAAGTLDSMLAQIVLREKYDMHPAVSVSQAPWREALVTHEAVLVTGDAAQDLSMGSPAIDLGDEWYDMTQLPLVRGVVGGWNHRLTAAFSDAIHRAATQADHHALLALQAVSDGRLSPDEMHLIPPHYRYIMDDDVREALDAFFRFAFYHGLHRDIPTFSIWSQEEAESAS